MARITWPEIEAALHTHPPPGWKRLGQREWGGPCPVTGVGETKAWVKRGAGDLVFAGCRVCGDGRRLAGTAFREHLTALCGGRGATGRILAPSSRSRSTQVSTMDAAPTSTAPADVWAAGADLHNTPGRTYLVERRRVWMPAAPLPVSLRWLPLEAARTVLIRGRTREYPVSAYLPDGAAGVLLYRFAAPGEADTLAVQMEAVDGDGAHLDVMLSGGRREKRMAAPESDFGGGRRVFQAAAGAAESRSWSVAEGPVDALAVVTLSRLGVCGADPRGAVVGVNGTSGLRSVSAPPGRRAVVWCQGDGPGYEAALQAALRLGAEMETAPKGRDWADVVSLDRADDVAEREAIADG